MPKPNRVIRPKLVIPPYNPNYIDSPIQANKKVRLSKEAYDFLAANPSNMFSKTLLTLFARK